MENCIDCPNHRIISDPDPDDSFCSDDVAVICIKVLNPELDKNSKYLSDHNEFRIVTPSCRPYNIRKEGTAPEWCPLKAQEDEQAEVIPNIKKELMGLMDELSARRAKEESARNVFMSNNDLSSASNKEMISQGLLIAEAIVGKRLAELSGFNFIGC